MNLLPLAVQILIPASVEEEAALIDACSRANADDPCVRVEVGSVDGRLSARVSGLGSHRVLVEVQGLEERELYASARLSFSPEDDSRERARSIGLSVGTLATTLLSGVRPQDPSFESPPELPSSHQPAPLEVEATIAVQERGAASRWLFHLGAGIEVSPSWKRLGPTFDLGAMWAPWGHFSLGIRGALGFVPGNAQVPQLLHGGGSAGVGYVAAVGSTLLVPQVEFGFEAMNVHLRDSQLPGSSQTRLSPVARISLGWSVPTFSQVRFQIEPSLELLLSPTRVFVDDEDRGSIGSSRFVLRLGGAWVSPVD